MKRALLIFCIFAVILTVLPGLASAKAALWLFPDSDLPRQGGHITGGELTLNVENRGHGNGDNTAYGVQLLVSVNDPSLLTQATVGETSFDSGALSFGTPIYTCSGRETPRHGVFPADYLTIDLGDIESGAVVRLEVVIEGAAGLEVHFDAYGEAKKDHPRHGEQCEDLYNSFGHDVTAAIADDDGGGDDGECPEVTISKEVDPSQVIIGDEATYVITVGLEGVDEEGGDEGSGDEGTGDEGSCDLTEVTITDSLPTVVTEDGEEVPAFSIVAVDPAATSESDTEISWSFESLLAGEELSLVVTVAFDNEAADNSVLENTACIDAAELDEAVCATAETAVGDAVIDGTSCGTGYWCNQIRFALEGHPGAQLTVDELDAWMLEILETSDVFDELVLLPDLVTAQSLLCGPGGPTTAEEKLTRHLLALWFNVTSGGVDTDMSLDALCSFIPLPDETDTSMTIGAVLLAAESDLLSGEADDATLLGWKDIIEFINSSQPAGEDGCDDNPEALEQRRLRPRQTRRGGWIM